MAISTGGPGAVGRSMRDYRERAEEVVLHSNRFAAQLDGKLDDQYIAGSLITHYPEKLLLLGFTERERQNFQIALLLVSYL